MRQKIILLILAFLLPITAFAWSNDIWDGSREGGYDFEVDGIYITLIPDLLKSALNIGVNIMTVSIMTRFLILVVSIYLKL